MKNIWLITLYTLREALARKVFIFFLVVILLALAGFTVFASFIKVEDLLKSLPGLDEQTALKQVVSQIELIIISPICALGLLLSFFACSSFIPIMLEKGNIDLILSKPISRSQLLLGKYFGGILVVLLNVSVLIVGIWLIILIKFSIVSFSLLFAILTITFSFSVLYSIIVLSGIISGSTAFGMMISYAIYLIISPLLAARNIWFPFIQNEFAKKTVTFFYYILPKTSEIDKLTSALVLNQPVANYQQLYSSFIFLTLMIGISIYIFEKKDF